MHAHFNMSYVLGVCFQNLPVSEALQISEDEGCVLS